MKNLLLVRHAKAEPMREFDYDFTRHLVKKGLKDAKKMADKIKNRLSGKVLFISSNSDRAFETAHVFAGRLDYPTTKILLKDFIYHDPKPEQFLELINATDDSYDTIILFGHNPSLNLFASSLIKDFEFDIPKCGVAAFEFDKNSWKEIEKQGGVLKFAEYPVRKSEEVSAFENTLIVKITQSIMEALENINPDAANNLLKSIAKHSAKLAGNFTDTLKRHKIAKHSEKLAGNSTDTLKRDKADKKSCHKTDEKIEYKAGEKNKLERDEESDCKTDRESDCKAKADKKNNHKKDGKHKKDEHKNDEKANIELDKEADIISDTTIDEQPATDVIVDEEIDIKEETDVKLEEKFDSESIKKTDSKEKSGKKGEHKQHKKSGHSKTVEKIEHESDVLSDWDTDEKNGSEIDTNNEFNNKIDKKDDWGIDEPSTNQ
ncbi:MAG: histidine phosphatase family protein [Desulfamplus sp.]|nr:histidine phosphatase family protein [Desulfamplus sp.]